MTKSRFLLLLTMTALVSSVLAVPAGAEQPDGVVRFVYFVEKGDAYDPDEEADIERSARAIQQFWYDSFGGTFLLNEPVVDVIYADHDLDWYLNNADGIHDDPRWWRLGNVKNEVYAELGLVDFDPSTRVVNYPTGRSDGKVGANFGGAWMDGDDLWCLSGFQGSVEYPFEDGVTYPYDEADWGAAQCLGHVSHELGHVFGLEHTGPLQDCMQQGFYIATGGIGLCEFFEENVQTVMVEPSNTAFLAAKPGDQVGDVADDPFDDDDGSIFEGDIEWLADQGITTGCGPRSFCPDARVTRGQMAAFLERALGLPPSPVDAFDDDDTSEFEGDIQALAAAGITKGCEIRQFCPDQRVTRQEMAAFLVRAFELPSPGPTDTFDDDDTSIFEDDIERLAAARITVGCGPRTFCGTDSVTRAEMAAFLRRALTR